MIHPQDSFPNKGEKEQRGWYHFYFLDALSPSLFFFWGHKSVVHHVTKIGCPDTLGHLLVSHIVSGKVEKIYIFSYNIKMRG